MANKNINELEVLEALEGGEKVLLSTDNGAKLFDAAGIASSGGGAGEDITIVLELGIDDDDYGCPSFEELKIKRVECSIDEEQFMDKITNGVLRLCCYGVTEESSAGPESPAMISTVKLSTQGIASLTNFSYIYGDMATAMIGVENAIAFAAVDSNGDAVGGHDGFMFFGFVDGEFTRIEVSFG